MILKKFLKPGESIEFEHLGYFVEYIGTDNTYFGVMNIDEPDREIVGYYGRQDYIAEEDIYLKHNRVIPKGTHYFTRLYPLCGKWLNKPKGFPQ